MIARLRRALSHQPEIYRSRTYPVSRGRQRTIVDRQARSSGSDSYNCRQGEHAEALPMLAKQACTRTPFWPCRYKTQVTP
ncbi:hypothetical protein [Novosphingobium sp.]|uniref:hypothetical protein n=1 Tax=Novosphingobium sp. TaxID=1874826 RepID=UPI0026267A84|nr:hypothetical protein [Novosphingobium sp.]